MRRHRVCLMLVVLLAVVLLPHAATAVTSTGFSGTVTGPADQSLEGIMAAVWRYEGAYEAREFIGIFDTDASGEYLVTSLQPGTYRVAFAARPGVAEAIYAMQCYGGEITLPSSDDVVVTQDNMTTGIDAKLELGGWITGIVENAVGDRLRTDGGFISVQPYHYSTSNAVWEPVQWGSDPGENLGEYFLQSLQSGTYRLKVTDNAGVYPTEWYENELTVDLADDIVVTTGSTTSNIDIVLTKTPFGSTPVEGETRYETALETSQEAFADGTASCVVITTGMNWPDALGGAALAAAKGGPILLTSPTALSAGIITEITRLGASEAIVLGSTDAVSQAVEDALVAELGAPNVSRIGGDNRYETAEMIAEACVDELNAGAGYDGTAFVTTALNFPDALAASPLAAAKGWPIYLTPPTALRASTEASMAAAGVTDVLILGSDEAVFDAVEADLVATYGDPQVTRLEGDNRYATGVVIATYGVDNAGLAWDGVAISTGLNFPDALAGGVLQGRDGSVLLLTPKTYLAADPEACLTTNRDWIAHVKFLGSTDAVSQDVRDEVAAILN